MSGSHTFVYILAFIVIAHLVAGFGYLMYQLSKPVKGAGDKEPGAKDTTGNQDEPPVDGLKK